MKKLIISVSITISALTPVLVTADSGVSAALDKIIRAQQVILETGRALADVISMSNVLSDSLQTAAIVTSTVSTTESPSLPPPPAGKVKINRVGADLTFASAPSTLAGIDTPAPSYSANPVSFPNVIPGTHTVVVSDILGYSETAGICTAPLAAAGDGCAVSSFEMVPDCSAGVCSFFIKVASNVKTKIVVRYLKDITPPPPAPYISITSEPRHSGGIVNIKKGERIVITGHPVNLGKNYSRAFFFDTIFDDSCQNNDWEIWCTANRAGTSKFYIEVYEGGRAFASNVITVNVSDTPVSDITVISPNGGETWRAGSYETITWKSTPDIPTVDIVLETSNPPCGIFQPCRASDRPIARYQIAKNIINTGSYLWIVGNNPPNDIPAGHYTITVNQYNNLKVSDTSDVAFKITRASSNTNNAPVIVGVPAVPANIQVGEKVSFALWATDADGDDLSWGVGWGDGTAMASICSSAQPQNKQNWNFSDSHSWANAGPYSVTFTVSDCRGESASYTVEITVGKTTAPYLSYLVPSSGLVGTRVAVYGSGFALTGNTVKFGIGYVPSLASPDGATLSFTVPEGMSPCDPDLDRPLDRPCALGLAKVIPGVYNVAVKNKNGTSNTVQFIVTSETIAFGSVKVKRVGADLTVASAPKVFVGVNVIKPYESANPANFPNTPAGLQTIVLTTVPGHDLSAGICTASLRAAGDGCTVRIFDKTPTCGGGLCELSVDVVAGLKTKVVVRYLETPSSSESSVSVPTPSSMKAKDSKPNNAAVVIMPPFRGSEGAFEDKRPTKELASAIVGVVDRLGEISLSIWRPLVN